MLNTITILGVSVTNENKEKILEYLFSSLKSAKKKLFIITPNPEMLIYANSHLGYKNKLNSSSIALPDGVGLFFAAGLLNKNLKERITGVDFMEDVCKKACENPVSMGFLGGRAGVAERTAECLKKKYPWINVVFTGTEWPQNDLKNKETTNKSIDILFVAYGVPKQEEWIYEHLDAIPVKAAMGVGGAFDFISGSVRRAPFIIRYAGLEWLFRLFVQPWRWKRQVALIEFIFLIFKEKFSSEEKK